MTTELMMIMLLMVFIVDLSDFMDEMKRLIWKVLKGPEKPYYDFPFKPFDCSLCMTWWVCLIWLLANGQFTLGNICVTAVLSWSTVYVKELIYYIGDLIQNCIDGLYGMLK